MWERSFLDQVLLTRARGLSLRVSAVLLVRFRSLLRHLRLHFRSRSGFLLTSEEANGLILFRSRGLRRLRSGFLPWVKVLGLVFFLLKEALLGPALLPLPDLRDSVHRFRLGRVLDRLVILRVGRDSLVRLGSLRLSGRISLVLLGLLLKLDPYSLLVGLCRSLGVRLSQLRKEILELYRRTRMSSDLRLAHLKQELRRNRGRQTARLAIRLLLVGRWIGIQRWIRY